MLKSEREAVETLYLEIYDSLFAYAYSSLESHSHAEEVVQDTFFIACDKAKELLHSENPRGWLFNTLKYTISNQMREESRLRQQVVEYTALYKDNLLQGQEQLPVKQLFAKVWNSPEFQIVKERVIDGLTYQEMATARGISEAACRKRLERAKKYLRKFLEND